MVELQGHEKAMGKVRTKKELRGVHVSPSEAMVRLWSWLTIAKVQRLSNLSFSVLRSTTLVSCVKMLKSKEL